MPFEFDRELIQQRRVHEVLGRRIIRLREALNRAERALGVSPQNRDLYRQNFVNFETQLKENHESVIAFLGWFDEQYPRTERNPQ